MIKVTSVVGWNDSVGKRMSITFSEIDDKTGKIISDNKRTDIVVTDEEGQGLVDKLLNYAQGIVDKTGGLIYE